MNKSNHFSFTGLPVTNEEECSDVIQIKIPTSALNFQSSCKNQIDEQQLMQKEEMKKLYDHG